MRLVLIGLLPAAIGFLLIRSLDSGAFRFCRHDVFRLILGAGVGIGLTSECYFAGLIAGVPGLTLDFLLLLAAATTFILNRRRTGCCFCEKGESQEQDSAIVRSLSWAFAALMILDLVLFAWIGSRKPHGGWDAWAIWNLRARFLYREGGLAWRDAFTEALAWSHPDYPLLLSASVARGWQLEGRETSAVPLTLACFFSFGCVGLLVGVLTILRGIRQGLLGGLALAATPFLYVQGAMQCADVPVAFFRLGSLAALALANRFESRGWAVIAGGTAALGAWTKNEGLLWFGALLVAQALVSRRMLAEFMAGSLPVLAPVLFFKLRIATSSDIFGAAGRTGMMARFLDPARYALIARELGAHILNFGPLLIGAPVILGLYLAVTGLRLGRADNAALRTGTIALLLTTVGYFLIYLLRTLDLSWLIETSSDRLLLQLWPAAVFIVFLACRDCRTVPVS